MRSTLIYVSIILRFSHFSSLNVLDANKSAASAPLFVPSKWESVDPDKAVEEAVTSNRWDIFTDPAALPEDPPVEVVTSKDDSDEDVDGR